MINTNKSKKLNDQQVEILYMRYMMKNILKKNLRTHDCGFYKNKNI